MTRAKVADREKTATRLLNSSADKFYDPEVDIDWSAPIDPDKYFTPPHRVSLYGTELWDRLTPEQQVELGKHEAFSVASTGIWFEVILMKFLIKNVYDSDPTSRHAQYALTEIADECRHSIMFARAIEHAGVPAYGPSRMVHRLGKVLGMIGYGPAMYGAILIGEEIPDRLQRESMADEGMQPLVRMVNRIHVLEEARHVRFAREELMRTVGRLSGPELAYQRWLVAEVAFHITRSLVNPKVYAAVGLDPARASRAARTNPHYQESVRWAGERVMGFLDEVGLVGRPGMRMWRRSFLLT